MKRAFSILDFCNKKVARCNRRHRKPANSLLLQLKGIFRIFSKIHARWRRAASTPPHNLDKRCSALYFS